MCESLHWLGGGSQVPQAGDHRIKFTPDPHQQFVDPSPPEPFDVSPFEGLRVDAAAWDRGSDAKAANPRLRMAEGAFVGRKGSRRGHADSSHCDFQPNRCLASRVSIPSGGIVRPLRNPAVHQPSAKSLRPPRLDHREPHPHHLTAYRPDNAHVAGPCPKTDTGQGCRSEVLIGRAWVPRVARKRQSAIRPPRHVCRMSR